MSDTKNKLRFYVDGNDLMLKLKGQEFKLAQKDSSDQLVLEEKDFLNEIHKTDLITDEVMAAAQRYIDAKNKTRS